ncbi:MAG: eda, partial [Proteobacteria bacterium]|nr:eda [Pseudomonadota bacterium]
DLGVPLLPGVATASEAMVARAKGYRVVKFFPAGPAGGPKYLQALASPLGDMVFCPTGGVSLDNAADYLKLKNVICVGGSWGAPADAVRDGDWARIERLARDAAALGA